MTRSNEKGIALILALFMVVVLSTLSVSLMFVSQTETWSSQNYKMMSQARYGAESGVHKVANHLMFTYVPAGMNPADPLAAYNMTVAPCVATATNCTSVTANNLPVVLTPNAATSDYPVQAVKDAYAPIATGTLVVNDANGRPVDNPVTYSATARLIAMRNIVEAYTLQPVTLQTWEITSTGSITGARSAETEVSAVLERPAVPAYSYAAFATYNGCQALSFFGGGSTDSYDSRNLVGGMPVIDNWGGNVGTNGNLDENGAPTVINGSLSTPRSGVGNCTANNVTAQTLGGGSVTEGLVQLAQPITMPPPGPLNPLPPTTNVLFTQAGGCPAGMQALLCTNSVDGATLTPAATGNSTVYLGNITTSGNSVVHLNAGTYIINSLTQAGNSKIVIDSGPVIFKVEGDSVATPISLTGQGVVNTTYDPQQLQFIYGGTGNVQMAGGAQAAALLYAPNASGAFTGGSDWYGAVVLKYLREGGGATIHYDRALENSTFVAGNWVMNAFTWKKY
jgi:Tfp pilus assembly protein PilX